MGCLSWTSEIPVRLTVFSSMLTNFSCFSFLFFFLPRGPFVFCSHHSLIGSLPPSSPQYMQCVVQCLIYCTYTKPTLNRGFKIPPIFHCKTLSFSWVLCAINASLDCFCKATRITNSVLEIRVWSTEKYTQICLHPLSLSSELCIGLTSSEICNVTSLEQSSCSPYFILQASIISRHQAPVIQS